VLPISVDLSDVRVLLIGAGAAACRRLSLLDGAGAGRLQVFAPHPSEALLAAAGGRLQPRLPTGEEIAQAQLLFVVGLDDAAAREIRIAASAAGVLANFEDEPARCDFHSASVLRRGDLTIAVSTNGRGPGLAGAIRRDLEQRYGPEWQHHLEEFAVLRAEWRQAGADHRTIAEHTAQWLAATLADTDR